MNKNATPVAARGHARGFTLVEILVGLVLGLIGIIVMYQMFAVFEGQKRTNVSSSDAQVQGLIALNTIQLHGRNAGAGLLWSKPVDESNYQTYVLCTTINVPGTDNVPFMPAYVENDTTNGSDRLTVAYSTSRAAATPAVLGLTAASNTAALSIKNTANTLDASFPASSYALIAQPTAVPVPIPAVSPAVTPVKPCAQLRVGTVTAGVAPAPVTTASVTHVAFGTPSGLATFPGAGTCPAGYTLETNCGATLVPDAVVVPMGDFVWIRYSVNSSNQLIAENRTANTTEILADDVIAFHVQYGITPPNCTQANPVPGGDLINCQGQIRWINAVDKGAAIGNFATPQTDAGAVARIKAIRVAIATRGALPERDNVTAAQSGTTCTGTGFVIGTNKLCMWADNTVSGNNDDAAPQHTLSGSWQNYRYRVFETIVPLRNVLWGNV